jgi:flagellar biosynthesis/type III secretory pathway chaperone
MEPSPQDLDAVLAAQVRCAEQMLEALDREHEALVGGSPNDVANASNAKADLVEALETLETRRGALAADADGAQLESAEWRRLRELVADCQRRNQRNGVLLKARADNVRVALNALRGAEPELYGPQGRRPGRSDARPLGTA